MCVRRVLLAGVLAVLVTPLAHGQSADWSWIESLNYSDEAARRDLKACLLANAARLAAIESAAFEYEGIFEHFTPPIHDGRMDVAHRLCVGRGRYRRGHFHNEITFDGGKENELKISALWTPALLATTEKHVIYGTFLVVDQPPASVSELGSKHFLLPHLDPRWLICGFLGGDPIAFRQFTDRVEEIGTAREGNLVHLIFSIRGQSFRAHAYFDPDRGFRLVKTWGGRVQSGRDIVDLEETREWRADGQNSLPSHFRETRFVGPSNVAVLDYDFEIKNVSLNASSGVSAAEMTLDSLGIPDGTHGVDRRLKPVRTLVRINGHVREPRPGDVTKTSPALAERLKREQKLALEQREVEARATLASRWRWSIVSVCSLATAVLLGGFIGWRVFHRLRLT